jgi:hypothetical protein
MQQELEAGKSFETCFHSLRTVYEIFVVIFGLTFIESIHHWVVVTFENIELCIIGIWLTMCKGDEHEFNFKFLHP